MLPRVHHEQALILMGRHLGQVRTLARLCKRFWWPGITKDVVKYCEICPEYQKISKRGSRAPMVPTYMPIIGEPFERIAMHVIGPLPRTIRGKQYILEICDYATRYPEVYAMRTVTAPAMAEKLIDLFSCYEVHQEILYRQGSNFMSELLKEVCRVIRIKPIHTSPYHPQTNGLVERYNQTQKPMLNKCWWVREELGQVVATSDVCLQRGISGVDWVQSVRTNLWSWRTCKRSTGHTCT